MTAQLRPFVLALIAISAGRQVLRSLLVRSRQARATVPGRVARPDGPRVLP